MRFLTKAKIFVSHNYFPAILDHVKNILERDPICQFFTNLNLLSFCMLDYCVCFCQRGRGLRTGARTRTNASWTCTTATPPPSARTPTAPTIASAGRASRETDSPARSVRTKAKNENS